MWNNYIIRKMQRIFNLQDLTKLTSILEKQNLSVVLVGGCFDLLHLGHIIFLEKAKKQADILVLLLESDQKIAKLKGRNRPLNKQSDRAMMLASLKSVDYVIKLPFIEKESEYDNLVKSLKPKVIATSKGDKHMKHKQRSAKLVNAKLKIVTKRVAAYSSSQIINKIKHVN